LSVSKYGQTGKCPCVPNYIFGQGQIGDKLENVPKKSLNHAGLNDYGQTGENEGQTEGQKLYLLGNNFREMSLEVQKNRYRNKGAMHPPLVTL
jgi:hypothetical protein